MWVVWGIPNVWLGGIWRKGSFVKDFVPIQCGVTVTLGGYCQNVSAEHPMGGKRTPLYL